MEQSEVVIYTTSDGTIQLNVKLIDETVWLSLDQMSQLFGRDKSVISRHLNNIFKINELDVNSVVAKYATTAADGKTYQVDYYNLDAIISVGYRVNSKVGVLFRRWASTILKKYIISGYAHNKKRLSERGLYELEQSVQLLKSTLTHNSMLGDVGAEAIQIIINYTKTWRLLLAFDEDRLEIPKGETISTKPIQYECAISAIAKLKIDLAQHGEASELFGRERDPRGLEAILKNIEQSYADEYLYQSTEEKAAHLLYFIIKDHPFIDGNKRIGCLLFLLYLEIQQIHIRLNDNGLVALALLIAESQPSQKDLIIKLTVNLLVDISGPSSSRNQNLR